MQLVRCLQKLQGLLPVTILLLILVKNTVMASIETAEASQSISVQNGSSSGVVIDCPYQLQKDDDTLGLEVKWYYNNKPRPVYQWIPGNTPQDLGILTDRLDKGYKVSKEAYSKHRALAIKEPTIELSGSYTCWVSNFNGEVNMVAHLLVYIPASNFYITTNISPEKNSLIVTCRAEGVFPLPDFNLFRITPHETKAMVMNRDVVEDVKIDSKFLSEDGTHVITLEREFKLSELDSHSEFVCQINIPNTEYSEERKTIVHTKPLTSTIPISSTTYTPTISTFLTSTNPGHHSFGSGGLSLASDLSRNHLTRWICIFVIVSISRSIFS